MNGNTLKILIIDGSSKVREALADLLTKQLGTNTIHVATNGSEGWEIIQKQALDLVVCNRALAKLNGFELLLKIRESKKYNKLPLLMILNKKDPEAVRRAQNMEANGVICKPFTPADFINRTRSILFNRTQRTSKRYDMPFDNQVALDGETLKGITGRIINIGVGGILVQLKYSRNLAIYDQAVIKIQIKLSKKESMANSFTGKLIRIDWDHGRTGEKTGFYAFVFGKLPTDQLNFFEILARKIESATKIIK
ncbi:MAG: response regulator [Desulfobulbaceae bacterium]|nr:response regulator [Desulfobulbaceae bacterium]HIJ79114.1 response regulator [Deltaproteobacteria bacterium]